MDNHKKRKEKV